MVFQMPGVSGGMTGMAAGMMPGMSWMMMPGMMQGMSAGVGGSKVGSSNHLGTMSIGPTWIYCLPVPRVLHWRLSSPALRLSHWMSWVYHRDGASRSGSTGGMGTGCFTREVEEEWQGQGPGHR